MFFSHRSRHFFVVGACVFAISLAAAGARDQAPTPAQNGAMSEEELARVGEQLVNKVCNTSCHGLEKLDELRRTGRDWSDQVNAMQGRGALASAEQFTTIKKYLTRYYGFVAVNTATADELSAVMGFTAKDAQAIVAYRTAHGKFADLDALLKVPGLDKAKIDEQPEALRFN